MGLLITAAGVQFFKRGTPGTPDYEVVRGDLVQWEQYRAAGWQFATYDEFVEFEQKAATPATPAKAADDDTGKKPAKK